MRRDPRVPLADIDRAGAGIERFTEGMNGDAYAPAARLDIAAAVGVYSLFVLFFGAEPSGRIAPGQDALGRVRRKARGLSRAGFRE